MDFTNLKTCMDKLIDEHNVPGLDVIVNYDHKEVFRYTRGFSDIENKRKMQGNELYDVYSMTKLITCVCALQLVEKGKILLDDEIFKFLPEFEKMKISEHDFDDGTKVMTGTGEEKQIKSDFTGFAKNQITIKHLFTMSAGLDYAIGSDYIQNAVSSGVKSTREIVKTFSQTVLGFEPGTRFRYSLCHDVLGAIIEVVSGKKFGDYMKENVFEPLGMKNTSFDVSTDERVMVKYRKENGIVKKVEQGNWFRITDEYQSGGAGLVSTTEDYALFLDALACGGVGKNGNRILSEELVELMGTNQLSGKALEDFDKLRKGYGYGLGVRTHLDPASSGSLSPVGEFGWDGAAGAFALIDTKNKLSLTYLQQMYGWSLETQNLIRNALYSCLNRGIL